MFEETEPAPPAQIRYPRVMLRYLLKNRKVSHFVLSQTDAGVTTLDGFFFSTQDLNSMCGVEIETAWDTSPLP